jgi:hypothetical protein
MPDVVESPAYDPDVFEVHKVTTNGTIKFEKRYFSVSRALTGENVGLRYLGESRWVGHYIQDASSSRVDVLGRGNSHWRT